MKTVIILLVSCVVGQANVILPKCKPSEFGLKVISSVSAVSGYNFFIFNYFVFVDR